MRIFVFLYLIFMLTITGHAQPMMPVEPLPIWFPALKTYLTADEKPEKQKAARKLLRKKPEFDLLFAGLRKGRDYDSAETSGMTELSLPDNEGRFRFSLVYVPKNSSPGVPRPVNIYLHGAVNGFVETAMIDKYFKPNLATYADSRAILVFPAGWYLAPWLSDIQPDNLMRIIHWLKCHFNIDENRISLAGCSDGGTGIFHMANTIPTAFSGFYPVVGYLPGVNDMKTRGFFPVNLSNKPLFAVNALEDDIFNAIDVEPYMKFLKSYHPDMVFYMMDKGHSCELPEALKAEATVFKTNHPRNPLPDTLVWETDNDSIYNRIHWLVVDEIRKTKSETIFADSNKLEVDGVSLVAFPHPRPSGRVWLARQGNTVWVKTRGVGKFTLLMSPLQFNFDEPVTVVTNGSISFQQKLMKDPAVLLKWNIEDEDRTMLFGAEIHILVK